MSTNFKIATRRDGKTLHLKLVGDFDGTSAHELLNALKKSAGKSSRVFIHTTSLRDIHPFGLAVFRANLGALKRNRLELVFTGVHAPEFDPQEMRAS